LIASTEVSVVAVELEEAAPMCSLMVVHAEVGATRQAQEFVDVLVDVERAARIAGRRVLSAVG
jgi:hypothetical protein